METWHIFALISGLMLHGTLVTSIKYADYYGVGLAVFFAVVSFIVS